MKVVDDWVTLALIGTTRHRGSLPALPAEVSAVLKPAAASGPEDAALRLADALAVLSNFTRAGARPVPAPPPPEPSPQDHWPECSERAATLLARFLTAGPRELLVEWLAAARSARRRPPHRLLPALLDAAAANRTLRRGVEAVMDARGVWLARLNPRWCFAEQTQGSSDDIWQTGQRDQRLALLQDLRTSDPSRARELLQSTWAQEPAEERVRWLTVMTVGLGMEDEPFLEACLDDRGSRVREAAAELLSRLPHSRLVQRLTERLERMLVCKTGRTPSLDVALPASFDPGWARDGITERPNAKIGKKEWWLKQMLMRVPPRHWNERFGLEPTALLQAVTEDYRDSLAEAWMRALEHHPDEAWREALLDWICTLPAKRRGELLPAIPTAMLLAGLPRLLKEGLVDLQVARRLEDYRGPLTCADCEALAEMVVGLHRLSTWALSSLLNRLAFLVPTAALPIFQRRWTADALGERFRQCDSFFSILQLRHDLYTELHA